MCQTRSSARIRGLVYFERCADATGRETCPGAESEVYSGLKAQGPIVLLRIIILFLFIYFFQTFGAFWGPERAQKLLKIGTHIGICGH